MPPSSLAQFLPYFARTLRGRDASILVFPMTVQQTPTENDPSASMPQPLDSETAMLLRAVLLPHFEHATSWGDLCTRLAAKGYNVTFRFGHLVLADETGRPVCTGAMIGSPLARLADRLGRPKLRSTCDGSTAILQS